MRCALPLLVLTLASACSAPNTGQEPSLAPRAAEAIDPRLPIAGETPSGPVDASLAAKLSDLVGQARAGIPQFDARLTSAERLAAAAGAPASESWVAAQQSLSLLIEQFGVTTQAAASIDELVSSRLEGQRWIRPADQQAISAAAAEVREISDRQSAAIDRLKDRLAS